MKLYIYSDNHVVHAWDSNDYDHQIISGVLSMEFNRSGSLTFVVPPNNEAHKNGWIKDLKSVIRVKNMADDFEWYGRVLGRNVDFIGCCTYTCEGSLGRLNDTCVYPIVEVVYDEHGNRIGQNNYYLHHGWPKYTNDNPDPDLLIGNGPLFDAIVQQYNQRLRAFGVTRFDYDDLNSPTKEFAVSYYVDDPLIQQKEPSKKNASYENMFDYIQSNILSYGDYGFHIELSRRIIDGEERDLLIFRSNDPAGYTDEDGDVHPNFKDAPKALIFGRNLTNFSYKTDYSNVYTAMHFIGTIRVLVDHGVDISLEEEEFSTTREYVYPLEEPGYSVASYHNLQEYGLIMGHENLEGEFVRNLTTYNEHPSNAQIDAEYRAATEKFINEAKKRGEKLSLEPIETIEISGINIVDTDDTIPFRVNRYVPVISEYHNICAKYLCTAVSLDLCNPANNQFTLGGNKDGTIEKWASIAKQPLDNPEKYYEEVI